jgi:hypothetical protein
MAAPASTDKLHMYAEKACDNLEQLATGLAPIADDAAVQAVSKMAAACRKIASSLAQSSMKPEPQPTTDEAIASHMAARRQAAPPQQPAGY